MNETLYTYSFLEKLSPIVKNCINSPLLIPKIIISFEFYRIVERGRKYSIAGHSKQLDAKHGIAVTNPRVRIGNP